MNSQLQLLDNFTAKLPGFVLYRKVWGSYGHGTQLPTSDVDYLAVYQLPTREIASLITGPQTVDGNKPDFQAHELGKFCALLLKGNPGVVECLFTAHMQETTPVWGLLRNQRATFINQTTLRQYLGYCDGQLHRLDAGTRLHSRGGEYNTKWAYHLIRIALDAERIAHGEPPIVLKEGTEQALLMQIRAGKFEPDAITSMYHEIKQRINAIKVSLPETADRKELDAWLWKRRLEYLDQKDKP